MIAVKIQCGCGQRYSFEAEPVGGRMPSAVNCPACGADGTAAANEFIAGCLDTQPAAPAATQSPRLGIRIAVTGPANHSVSSEIEGSPAVKHTGSLFGGRREPKKKGLFSKIENKEDALKVTKDASGGFFAMAGLQAVGSIFLGPSGLIDAIVWASFAAMLRAWKSRIVAVLSLLMSVAVAVITMLNVLGVTHEGGGNMYIVIFMLLVSIRAVQATLLLHGRFAH